MRVLGGALRTQNGRTLARRKAISRARVSESRQRAELYMNPVISSLKTRAYWRSFRAPRARCENTNTRTSAFREMTGIEKARLWSRARPLACSATRLTVYDRNAEAAILGLTSLFLLPSASSLLIFSYLFLPFFFYLLRFHHYIISTFSDIFTINTNK